MGSELRDGQWAEAGDDVTLRLIDGRAVPKVQGYYKHLGIRQTPKADWAVARQVVAHRCGGIASALSRLGILTAEEYIDTVDAATTTVVAYYGAAFPIGRTTCEKIDVAKRRGLARMGHSGERTSRKLAHAPRPHGLGMAITWAHAAAALVVEMDRAINMPETAPAHVAVASRVAKEFWRWVAAFPGGKRTARVEPDMDPRHPHGGRHHRGVAALLADREGAHVREFQG
jgi:hypothetical protein